MHLSGSRIVLAGTALLVLVAGLLVGWAAHHSGRVEEVSRRPPAPVAPRAVVPSRRPPAAEPAAVRGAALAVLRDWDRARSAAWGRGDPAGLRALYVPGSGAGVADLAMLRQWRARGLRVRGMRTQVLVVDVRTRTPDRLVLVVTDRLLGAVAVPGGLPLPRDQPSTRRLELRRVAGRWLMAGVVPFSRG